ncbi:40S ribosomal protein S4-3 [Zea mays]|uniref:40S ribosomal protein S4-3 n=1 Tax=Zea mays TaxID=4577 RepID=A0A1D6DSN7_MAIZE|nr:40S ribosomal protein S4-3 [Zea mays]
MPLPPSSSLQQPYHGCAPASMVSEFLDSKSETDVDVDYNSLYSKQDFLQGEIHAIRYSYLRFARSHTVKYGVEITLQRLGVSGGALSVAAFGSTKSRINGGTLISLALVLEFKLGGVKMENVYKATVGATAQNGYYVAYDGWGNREEVTEENLATLFINCGQVVDCRMCGDPNSVLSLTMNVKCVQGLSTAQTLTRRFGTCTHATTTRNGTIKIDLETNKIMDFIKFDVGNVVMMTGGTNTGRVGVIKNREKHKGSFETIHVLLGAFCYV